MFPALGDEPGAFLFPHQHGKGAIEQDARGADLAESAVRTLFHQSDKPASFYNVVGEDLDSWKKLEAGLRETFDLSLQHPKVYIL